MPYTGHLLLRFERSTLREHSKARILVVRVLKILEPVNVVIPDYDHYLAQPREGELLKSHAQGGRTLEVKPYTIDLDNLPKCWQDLNLLYTVVSRMLSLDKDESWL
ncbi:hypothetical protein DXG01_012412 [Tephrocybe rancida]|nr:hypothetical protein DXG01_012412 [Tephrocybe rancida]